MNKKSKGERLGWVSIKDYVPPTFDEILKSRKKVIVNNKNKDKLIVP